MKTAYPEAMTFPEGLASTPSLAGLIDATIERFTREWRAPELPAGLSFPAELEATFERETRQARVRELRFTVSAAAAFMCVTTFTDGPLIPDVGWDGLKLRLVASAVFAASVAVFGRVSPRRRERVLFVATYFVLNVIVGVPSLSRAPTAPYGFFISFLAIVYANTTAPFRFRYAWRFSLLSLATIGGYMSFDPVMSRGIGGALMFMGVVGASYSLIANYRMERGARLGYLLASKEALRLFAMNREREKLATMSSTDALTGIANRREFDERLANLFGNKANAGREVHLLMLDVDFFKRYNDRYGHPAGDDCLRSVAGYVAGAMEDGTDLAFRYGGEEFGALLFDRSQKEVDEIAERVRGSVERAGLKHGGREDGLGMVTVSVGVARAVVGDGSDAASLLERADRSLYGAKKGGRNRVGDMEV